MPAVEVWPPVRVRPFRVTSPAAAVMSKIRD
jgi:hypothetical protein